MPQPVHLVNTLHLAFGGSELQTLALFEELAQYGEVNLWTEYKPDARFAGSYPIRGIEPNRGVFPKGGTLVFIGVFFGIGRWVREAKPKRVIVFFNTPDWDRLEPVVESLRHHTGCEVEVVYHCHEQRKRFPQYPGPTQPCFIDLDGFVPVERSSDEFVVGRMSRDDPEKHHREDPLLYSQLAELGCKVAIQGGMPLRAEISDPRIWIAPAGTVPPVQFLQSLDCFVYRVGENLFEAWGRVIAEAMAVGLPVVAERRGGYTEFIEDGKTGFLFDTTEEAVEIVKRLKDDPALRKEIGHNARQAITELLSPESRRKIAEFYLDSSLPPSSS